MVRVLAALGEGQDAPNGEGHLLLRRDEHHPLLSPSSSTATRGGPPPVSAVPQVRSQPCPQVADLPEAVAAGGAGGALGRVAGDLAQPGAEAAAQHQALVAAALVQSARRRIFLEKNPDSTSCCFKLIYLFSSDLAW